MGMETLSLELKSKDSIQTLAGSVEKLTNGRLDMLVNK